MRTAKAKMYGTLAHMCAAMLVATGHADEPLIPRIGVVTAQESYEQGLREGLVKLGYVERKNIAIEWRRSGGSVDQERSLAIDLLRSKPNVIVAFGLGLGVFWKISAIVEVRH